MVGVRLFVYQHLGCLSPELESRSKCGVYINHTQRAAASLQWCKERQYSKIKFSLELRARLANITVLLNIKSINVRTNGNKNKHKNSIYSGIGVKVVVTVPIDLPSTSPAALARSLRVFPYNTKNPITLVPTTKIKVVYVASPKTKIVNRKVGVNKMMHPTVLRGIL